MTLSRFFFSASKQQTIPPYDAGISLLKFAFCVISINTKLLNKQSFDKDEHQSLITSNEHFVYNRSEIMRLRTECQQLIVCVTHKFHTSKANVEPHCNVVQCNRYNSENESDDDTSGDDSSDEDSVFSHTSDESFEPSDNDIELNDIHKLYGDDESVFQDDSDDDSAVDECYSDFMYKTNTTMKGNGGTKTNYKPSDVNDYYECDATQNLICPGDVIQYRTTVDDDAVIRKNTVMTINDKNMEQYIVLLDGTILHPSNHIIRKTESICNETNKTIPVARKQWYHLDKCLVQSGSIGNHDTMHESVNDESPSGWINNTHNGQR